MDKIKNRDIVKALDICSKSNNGCSHSNYSCEDCYLNGQPMCSTVLLQDTLDLINRLQAQNGLYETCNARKDEAIKHLESEVKRLKEKAEKCFYCTEQANKKINEIIAEAYKEFAERLKEKMEVFFFGESGYHYRITDKQIDNLLNELKGE